LPPRAAFTRQANPVLTANSCVSSTSCGNGSNQIVDHSWQAWEA
jgi:hypothetical protein